MERRKEGRFVLPDLYRQYVTLKIRETSGRFVDAELFNFSPQGIRIRSRYELHFDSTIECLVSAPESFVNEILLKGRVKYCIQEEPMGHYLIGAKIIEPGDRAAFEIFSKIQGFVEEKLDHIP